MFNRLLMALISEGLIIIANYNMNTNTNARTNSITNAITTDRI